MKVIRLIQENVYVYKIFSSMLYVILFYYEVLKQYGIK